MFIYPSIRKSANDLRKQGVLDERKYRLLILKSLFFGIISIFFCYFISDFSNWFIGGVFFALDLFWLLSMYVESRKLFFLYNFGRVARGKITAWQSGKNGISNIYEFTVISLGTYSGKESALLHTKRSVGEEVTVYYDKDTPEMNMIFNERLARYQCNTSLLPTGQEASPEY